jgi:hypothetical protein
MKKTIKIKTSDGEEIIETIKIPDKQHFKNQLKFKPKVETPEVIKSDRKEKHKKIKPEDFMEAYEDD